MEKVILIDTVKTQQPTPSAPEPHHLIPPKSHWWSCAAELSLDEAIDEAGSSHACLNLKRIY